MNMAARSAFTSGLRARLKDKIMGSLDECYINELDGAALAGNLNIAFAYVEGGSC